MATGADAAARRLVLTLFGSAAISVVIWGSGTGATAAPAVIFVYVGVFASVALGPLAWVVLAISAAGHAVSASRDASSERERLLADLRSADEAKTAFLGAVGHDLTAPAANLVGLADLAANRWDTLPPDERRQLLGRLSVNAKRLHRDLDGLLRLQELTAGVVEIQRDTDRLDVLLQRAMARVDLPSERVELRDLEGRTLTGDLAKLEHALANLVSNAVKYGDDSTITIDAIESEDRLVIRVADRGPGVPEEMRERVFDPLVRAREADAAQGSGLGLSMVRAFAHLHGGEVWVEPPAGGGARFCLALPAGTPEHDRGGSGKGDGSQ